MTSSNSASLLSDDITCTSFLSDELAINKDIDCWMDNNNDLFARSPTSLEHSGMEALGADFIPRKWDVICGRGKTSFQHVGNRRFRLLIANALQEYNLASNRSEKAAVMESVLDSIDEAQGIFIRHDRKSSMWYRLNPKQAREKVGHSFRDCVPGKLRMPFTHEQFRKQNLQKMQEALLLSTLNGDRHNLTD